MHLHTLLKTALLLLSGTALYAAPLITMDVTFPSANTEIPQTLCATRDNGFVVGGTSVDSTGLKRGFLMKVDANGNRTGKIRLPDNHDNEVTGVVQAFDGGYVACGYYSEGRHGGDDWEIVKIDSVGNRIWAREFGFGGSDRPSCIIHTTDSGFVVAGYSSGSTHDTTGALIKLDKNGQQKWYRLYPSAWSVIKCVKQKSNGEYILTGGVKGCNAWFGGMDAFLCNVDSLGNILWYKSFGGVGDEIGYSVDITLDNGFVFAGTSNSFGEGDFDALVVKTNMNGMFKWKNIQGSSSHDVAYGIIQMFDGNFYVLADNGSHSLQSLSIIRLDHRGDSVGNKPIDGFINSDYFPSAFIKKSDSEIALGYSRVFNGDTITAVAVANCTDVLSIAAGFSHSFILKIDSTLWGCGKNSYGQLGDGTWSSRTSFVPVLADVRSVSCGHYHTLILKNDGTLWGCGSGEHGQIGITNSGINSIIPKHIMSGVKECAAGKNHSLILKNDGTVWACGNNSNGQLGTGTTTNIFNPILILSDVRSVSAGDYHSLFIKTDGTLLACGLNASGQLGDGTKTNRHYPVQIMSNVRKADAGFEYTLILTHDDSLRGCGSKNGAVFDSPTFMMADVQTMSAGYNHYLILKNDNTVWAAGDNKFWQLCDGTTTYRYSPVPIMAGVKDLAAGSQYSLLIDEHSRVWGCGMNSSGQLGSGSTYNQPTLEIVVPESTPCMKPVFLKQPSARIAGVYNPLQFYIIPYGNPMPSITWLKNGNISKWASWLYSISSLDFSDSGTYTVQLCNSAGCVTSEPATLKVDSRHAPVIISHPQSISGWIGQQVTFHVVADALPAPDFQWLKDGIPVSGSVDSVFRIPSISFSDTANYSVVVTNAFGRTTSKQAKLRVPLIIIEEHPKSIGEYPGDAVNLEVRIVSNGTQPPTYQWKKDGVSIPGATSSGFSIAEVAESDAGIYTVVISNSYSMIESNPAVFMVGEEFAHECKNTYFDLETGTFVYKCEWDSVLQECKCSSNEHWECSTGTCVPCQCPFSEDNSNCFWNGSNCEQCGDPHYLEPEYYGSYHWISSTRTCLYCSSYQYFDWVSETCVNRCPPGCSYYHFSGCICSGDGRGNGW